MRSRSGVRFACSIYRLLRLLSLDYADCLRRLRYYAADYASAIFATACRYAPYASNARCATRRAADFFFRAFDIAFVAATLFRADAAADVERCRFASAARCCWLLRHADGGLFCRR